jgi:hypothetical protein
MAKLGVQLCDVSGESTDLNLILVGLGEVGFVSPCAFCNLEQTRKVLAPLIFVVSDRKCLMQLVLLNVCPI